MEENVALDTSKQKQFLKSIKGIKKLIKKTEVEEPEPVVPTVKDVKKPKRKRPERGLVYLSHIPHGFYEHEMTQYFKQFGAVSNVRVIRSKRTGNSKGCAFIEFKQPAVAEIVAETMNNYLMGKRLLKAACIPPEKQRPRAMRKHWNRLNNPGRIETLKKKKAYNENKDKAGELARAKKILSVYKKNMKKLSDIGINYDFFSPVDIPEELVGDKDTPVVKDENVSKKTSNKVQKDSKTQIKDKNNKETIQAAPTKKEAKVEQKKVNPSKTEIKDKNNKETKKEAPAKKEAKVEQEKVNLKKEKVPEPAVNKKEQKQKQKKLKKAGVELPENFIKLQEGSDSDSSADFDSDDYNKMLENDSDVESDEERDSDDDENKKSGDDIEQNSDDEFQITGSDDDDSEVESEDEQIIYPTKKGKGKLGPMPPLAQVLSKKLAMQTKKTPHSNSSEPRKQKAKQAEKNPQLKGPIAPELGKRKATQKNVVSPKKPKFEKQTQQPMKKQFKKKK